MKFYNIETVFDFGKYAGKSVREVLDIQPSYIDWCIINLNYFYISQAEIDYIKSIKPDFTLSTTGLDALANKYREWNKIQMNIVYDHAEYDYTDDGCGADDFNWEEEAFYALTDGMYGDYYDEYGGDDIDFGSLTTFLGMD
jgi:hypothetical protein